MSGEGRLIVSCPFCAFSLEFHPYWQSGSENALRLHLKRVHRCGHIEAVRDTGKAFMGAEAAPPRSLSGERSEQTA